MAPFACPNCRRLIHFEARVCPACQFTLGYDPTADAFLFLGDGATTWRDAGGAAHPVQVCANNNSFEICNWLVPTADATPYCRACRHNRTIPDLTIPTVPERWGKIEAAKRRLFHTLLRLQLPIETRAEAATLGTGQGLAFDFLYDPAAEQAGNPQIMTGHDGGLVTLNLIEADDVQRERIRRELGEPYRTLVGHLRHEVGHHYFSRLVENRAPLAEFRSIFGDETIDYASAMSQHYGNGGTVWTTDYVSAYATMHPWEDFAETFAHYLHIVDALATIGGFGMRMVDWPGEEEQPAVDFDPYAAPTAQLLAEWRPFSFAQNAINRSMGQPDFYPFHLSPVIVRKIDFVNRLLHDAGRAHLRAGSAAGTPRQPLPQAATLA